MKLKFRPVLALGVLLGSAWWLWPKPDTFFSKLSMPIPAEFVVSHRSPFWLLALEDDLILKIPKAQAAQVQQVFVSQKRFEDVTSHLASHYAEFRAGEEGFFPDCPRSFQAGRFWAYDRQRHVYDCHFLFDQDDPNFTYLYLSSVSPTN